MAGQSKMASTHDPQAEAMKVRMVYTPSWISCFAPEAAVWGSSNHLWLSSGTIFGPRGLILTCHACICDPSNPKYPPRLLIWQNDLRACFALFDLGGTMFWLLLKGNQEEPLLFVGSPNFESHRCLQLRTCNIFWLVPMHRGATNKSSRNATH